MEFKKYALAKLGQINVGQTPLVYLEKYGVYAKLERYNPTGSVKDRPVYFMLLRAINNGLIRENSVIIEPTSGNTGISVAYFSALLRLKAIIVMPSSVSVERRRLIEAYGAEVVLVDNMSKAVEKALEIANELGGFILNQFENPNNVLAHKVTTGPEILRQMNFQLDAFVAGVGTAGTLVGVSEVLKSFSESIKVFAVQPCSSPVLTGGTPQPHKIQGIGPDFVPQLFNRSLVDEIVCVDDTEALKMTQKLWKEGIFVGISSAANLLAAVYVKEKHSLERVVTVFPDDGSKYISLF
ncbi:PLP-dependent cysteine synthase family protein [Fervidobacterium thailandense]|uniref:cysteine synthase n=1 Tax=Fervidobacterium thailandense TaxID=1008305 RepID=A0A1E3G3R6_9BACT|nr:cysteine synthase family protein [Fervidobacterium thailandense]ODN30453.1 cysteine synthase A [Fervidobacterium thailandense]